MQTTDMHSVPNGSGTVLVQRERERERKQIGGLWLATCEATTEKSALHTNTFRKSDLREFVLFGSGLEPGGIGARGSRLSHQQGFRVFTAPAPQHESCVPP